MENKLRHEQKRIDVKYAVYLNTFFAPLSEAELDPKQKRFGSEQTPQEGRAQGLPFTRNEKNKLKKNQT